MKLYEWTATAAIAAVALLTGLNVGSITQKDRDAAGWEKDRMLICFSPSLPNGRFAAVVSAIKYNGKYFEVVFGDQHYTYTPGNFETCRTTPVPKEQPIQQKPGELQL